MGGFVWSCFFWFCSSFSAESSGLSRRLLSPDTRGLPALLLCLLSEETIFGMMSPSRSCGVGGGFALFNWISCTLCWALPVQATRWIFQSGQEIVELRSAKTLMRLPLPKEVWSTRTTLVRRHIFQRSLLPESLSCRNLWSVVKTLLSLHMLLFPLKSSSMNIIKKKKSKVCGGYRFNPPSFELGVWEATGFGVAWRVCPVWLPLHLSSCPGKLTGVATFHRFHLDLTKERQSQDVGKNEHKLTTYLFFPLSPGWAWVGRHQVPRPWPCALAEGPFL